MNLWTVDSLKSIVGKNPDHVECTTFVFGEPGAGKTHLCQSLREYTEQQNLSVEAKNAKYLKDNDLTFNSDILLLDEGDSVINHAEAEFRLFSLIEESRESGLRLIVFSRSNQYNLGDLRTRTDNSLQLNLHPLSDAMVGKMLCERCHYMGLKIKDNVVQYVLRRMPRDGNSIHTLFTRLDKMCLELKSKEVTLGMVRELYNQY